MINTHAPLLKKRLSVARKVLSVATALACCAGIALAPSPSEAKPLPHRVDTTSIRIVGIEQNSKDLTTIINVVNDLLVASNKHDLEGVLEHYSPRFISGDNLTLDQVRSLIEETWALYPDIRYETETLEIRVNGDWATVESKDTAKATAKSDGDLSADPGQLVSESRGMLYLHRIGKTWEIRSDYTMYEAAQIYFGKTKELNFRLATPEQVFSGETYSARLDGELPKGVFAIATISKDPLVFPQPKPEEKFRTLTADKNQLERVFNSNQTNHNEIVTAIIGLTEVGQDTDNDRPTIQLNGVATLVKRVNVLPKVEPGNSGANPYVKVSADGKVDLRKQPNIDERVGDTSMPNKRSPDDKNP